MEKRVTLLLKPFISMAECDHEEKNLYKTCSRCCECFVCSEFRGIETLIGLEDDMDNSLATIKRYYLKTARA